MGRAVGPRLAAALRPRDPRTRRQQRRASSARRPISIWRCARSPSRAMGTAGQRCTTLRRLFVHESVYDELVPRLKKAYGRVTIGNPLEDGALVGPLIDKAAFDEHADGACPKRRRHGGKVTGGERVRDRRCRRLSTCVRRWSRCRRRPVRSMHETFAPILYVMKYTRLRRGARAAQRRAAGPLVVDLHQRHARGRALPVRRAAPTAASPTSISARRAPRSAAPSVARRKPAAAANPARMPGRPTCAARPTRSTTARRCRSRRASSSTSSDRRTHWISKGTMTVTPPSSLSCSTSGICHSRG